VIDADLIHRARAGDRAALDDVLQAYRGQLLAAAQRAINPRLQGRLDASDVVQQTCLSVFRQIGDFDGDEPAQFAAWLRQVHERNIQNAIRDEVRVQKRSLSHEEPLGDRDIAGHREITPSQHAARDEEADQLAAVLGELPPEERAVLELRYLEGWTLQQVSDYVGLSKEAVIWRMQKGMQRVRALLKEGRRGER
jgi:RNA polymerase sigma-70 factor, ECF subfamily